MPKTAIILILLIAVYLPTACGRPAGDTANSNTSSANVSEPASDGIKDNAEEFAAIADLPVEPKDVMWKETDADGKKNLLAVLRFSPEESKKLVELAAKGMPGANVSLDVEKWFPPELVAQSEMSGDEKIAATSFKAAEFLKPLYTEGRLSHVNNTDFFILEMAGQ